MAHESGTLATMDLRSIVPTLTGSTTDGARLFVTTWKRDDPNDITEVDALSRRVRRFAALPQDRRHHCIEWHDGLLYVAGGWGGPGFPGFLDSLQAFDERTALWYQLPPMPQSCCRAASGVIGNQLYVAGGYDSGDLRTLQIYDIATRTWRLGAPIPKTCARSPGIVFDGKLFVLCDQLTSRGTFSGTLVYDPLSNSWTEERDVPWRGTYVGHACAHHGRIVVFIGNRSTGYVSDALGAAYQRASDGSWSPYDIARDSLIGPSVGSESLLLG